MLMAWHNMIKDHLQIRESIDGVVDSTGLTVGKGLSWYSERMEYWTTCRKKLNDYYIG